MSKKIPKLKNEARERQFWSKHDSTDYIDWKKEKRKIEYLNSRTDENAKLWSPVQLLNFQ